MEAMQQMNVRIAPKLKQEGDSVLARLGLSPSEGIRKMYEFLVRNQNDRKKLDVVIGVEDEKDEAARERERKRKELLDFPNRVAKEYKALGIDVDCLPAVHRTKEDDRNAYLEALTERYAERGLL